MDNYTGNSISMCSFNAYVHATVYNAYVHATVYINSAVSLKQIQDSCQYNHAHYG